MKIFQLALAAGLLSFSAAAAQTTPAAGTPGPAGASSPEAVPSGMAPPAPDPKGNVTPGEVFTKGAPINNDRRMKHKKMKDTMPDGKGKMKTKM